MAEPITNRVAEREDLHVLNLKERLAEAMRWPEELDLEPFLYEGLIVREASFREALAGYDFARFDGVPVAFRAPEEALLPPWAVMLVGARLREGGALRAAYGSAEEVRREACRAALDEVDWDAYAGKLVILKADPDGEVPLFAYQLATDRLVGRARKIMFGEPGQATVVWRQQQETARRPGGVKEPDLPRPSA